MGNSSGSIMVQTTTGVTSKFKMKRLSPTVDDNLYAGLFGGMLVEHDGSTYRPSDWPNSYPIRDWSYCGIAQSTIGDGYSYGNMFMEFVGAEDVTLPGTSDTVNRFGWLSINMEWNDYYGMNVTLVDRIDFNMSTDYAKTWNLALSLRDYTLKNGVTLANAAPFFDMGCIVRLGPTAQQPYPITVLDNTFFYELNQIWLDDPTEREDSAMFGAIGRRPILEDKALPEYITDKAVQQIAVHSGNFGVIKSGRTVLASANTTTQFCWNSSERQVPSHLPFWYAVNKPTEHHWMGPMLYRSLPWDDPWRARNGNTSGGVYRATRWDGMGNILDTEWIPEMEAYPYDVGGGGPWWDWFAFPRYTFVEPIPGNTHYLEGWPRPMPKGDISAFGGIAPKLGSNSTTVPEYRMSFEDGIYRGGGPVYDQYRNSVWSQNGIKSYLLSNVFTKETCAQVADVFINQFRGIHREEIMPRSLRATYIQDPNVEIKQIDMGWGTYSMLGEYDITGKYNNMSRVVSIDLYGWDVSFERAIKKPSYYWNPAWDYNTTPDEIGFIVHPNLLGCAFGEYFPNRTYADEYAVSIIPCRVLGTNTLFGWKMYRVLASYVNSYTNVENIWPSHSTNGPARTYIYKQPYYGVPRWRPVYSDDGGVTWYNCTGFNGIDTTKPELQIRPIAIAPGVYVSQYDKKLFTSTTGIGWSPITQDIKNYDSNLDPDLEGDKTYLIGCAAPMEYVVIKQFTGLEPRVTREVPVVVDGAGFWIRTTQNSISNVIEVIGETEGMNRKVYTVAEVKWNNYIKLTEKVTSADTIYVTYDRLVNEARMFHIVADDTSFTSAVYDLGKVAELWEPKDLGTTVSSEYNPLTGYKAMLATMSGGVI